MRPLNLIAVLLAGSWCTVAQGQMPNADTLLREQLKSVTAEVENCRKDSSSLNASLKAIRDTLAGLEAQFGNPDPNKLELETLGSVVINPQCSTAIRLQAFDAVHTRLGRVGITRFRDLHVQVDAANEAAAKLVRRISGAEAIVDRLIMASESDHVVKVAGQQLKADLLKLQVGIPKPDVSIVNDANALQVFNSRGGEMLGALMSWPAPRPPQVDHAIATLTRDLAGIPVLASSVGLSLGDTESGFKSAKRKIDLANTHLPGIKSLEQLNKFTTSREWATTSDNYFNNHRKYLVRGQGLAGDQQIAENVQQLDGAVAEQLDSIPPTLFPELAKTTWDAFRNAANRFAERAKSRSEQDRSDAAEFARLGQEMLDKVRAAAMPDADLQRELQVALHNSNLLAAIIDDRFGLHQRIEDVRRKTSEANRLAAEIIVTASDLELLDLRLAAVRALEELENDTKLEEMLVMDSHPTVRREALSSYIRLQKSSLMRLESLAEKGDKLEQLAAISALAEIAAAARAKKDSTLLVESSAALSRLTKRYNQHPHHNEVLMSIAVRGLHAAIGEPASTVSGQPSPAAAANQTPAPASQ